jgi:hypothetical protein
MLLVLLSLSQEQPANFSDKKKNYTAAADTGRFRVFPAINGNTGLIMIPTARFALDKEIIFSVSTNPARYHILPFKGDPTGEKIFSVNLAFLPFVEITGTVIRPDNIDKSDSTRWGIGDRSVKIRFKLLNESKYFPSFVIGIHDFFAVNFHQSAMYFVSSKKVLLNRITCDFHLGYGFDVSKPPFTDTPLFSNDDSIPGRFLTGFFGGISFLYKTVSLNIEHDCHKMNAGFTVLLFNHLGMQLSTLGFDRLSTGISYRFIVGEPLIRKKL